MNPPFQVSVPPMGEVLWQQLMIGLPPLLPHSRVMGMPDVEFSAYRNQLRVCQKLMEKLEAVRVVAPSARRA